MNKNVLLMISILLSACSQPNQNKQTTALEKVQSKDSKTKQNPLIEKHVISDKPFAVFAYQEVPEGTLSKHCLWSDEPQAMGKQYWSIVPTALINGKAKFVKKDLHAEKVTVGKSIQNCNKFYKKEYTPFAYEINDEKDWVNTLALDADRIIQNSDKTISLDLDKNGKPEYVFACYNSLSTEVFFRETLKSKHFSQAEIYPAYSVKAQKDPTIECSKSFYDKIGLAAIRNPMTGELIVTTLE